MSPDHHHTDNLEPDQRFPSGPWVGYYRQGNLQSRQRLSLTFRDGRISGEGRDPVDPFIVSGTYDLATGSVRLSKTYTTHTVFYDGAADGDGVGGAWEIPYFGGIVADRGEFRIWPDELAMQEALEAAQTARVPVGG